MSDEQSDDGKIRVRCTGCGKRVKFPGGMPGATFRCPLCKTTLVAPLDDQNIAAPTGEELRSVRTGPAPMKMKEAPPPAARKPHTMDLGPKDPPIEGINKFLARETLQIGRLCMETFEDANLSDEQRQTRLKELRRVKAVHFKNYVEAALEGARRQVHTMADDPASETGTGRARLVKAEQELKGLEMYLSVMFEYRGAASGGATATPAAEAAPPSKPSTPGAQTPPA